MDKKLLDELVKLGTNNTDEKVKKVKEYLRAEDAKRRYY